MIILNYNALTFNSLDLAIHIENFEENLRNFLKLYIICMWFMGKWFGLINTNANFSLI